MNTSRLSVCPWVLIGVLVFPTLALAQWSSDPAVNLAIADRSGDQVQPKIHATSDGGSYITWYDNSAGGYDVYLQRLDSAGHEMWPHGGVLLANRSFSSTEDYGMDVDPSDNAVVVFRDDRTGGTVVTAMKVAPDGSFVWGTNGKQVSETGMGVHAPAVAATTTGDVVVAWTNEGASTEVHLQKLDASGDFVWPSAIAMAPSEGWYMLSDLQASNAGSVIVSLVKQGPMFWSPKHLHTQKVSADGAFLWGDSPKIVFDDGSLQFGNFPPFITDGSGGAIYSWYDVDPLQCFAQHINGFGVEMFPHNGAAASTLTSEARVSPSVCYNGATQETFMFWTEMNAAQSQHGVYGQKFDSVGARQWGAQGKALVAVGSIELTNVETLLQGDGAMVFWKRSPSAGNDTVIATRVDGNGDFVWAPDMQAIAQMPSDKSRITPTLDVCGTALVLWEDDRGGDRDVYGQNVFPDGSLGAMAMVPGDLDCSGDVNVDDIVPFSLALVDGSAYAAAYPCCRAENADVNDDGEINGADVQAFVDALLAF